MITKLSEPKPIECAVGKACTRYIPLVNAVAADYAEWERLHPDLIQFNERGDELGQCIAVAVIGYRHAVLQGIEGAEIQAGKTGGNDFWWPRAPCLASAAGRQHPRRALGPCSRGRAPAVG